MAGALPSVGFVGVGNMGWAMAACLVRAGFDVRVNDSRREVAESLAPLARQIQREAMHRADRFVRIELRTFTAGPETSHVDGKAA